MERRAFVICSGNNHRHVLVRETAASRYNIFSNSTLIVISARPLQGKSLFVIKMKHDRHIVSNSWKSYYIQAKVCMYAIIENICKNKTTLLYVILC